MDLRARLKPQAGGYAHRRYRSGLKRWRGRVMRPLRSAFLLVGALLFDGHDLDESRLDWYLGLAMGGLLGLWVAVADSPPA